MIKAVDFIHHEDAAALRQLESIPGFPALVKKVMSIGLEQLQYGINMASSIRLSEKQLPGLYSHLVSVCSKLGIKEPEFYLEMNPVPNAYTFGDSRVFITVTSGLVEMMTPEELDAVIAHECGHIMCHHVLYHSLARYILEGTDFLGILKTMTIPVRYALLYWFRKSELSCDRASALVTSPETVARVMARLAGGPREITDGIDIEEWCRQAEDYEDIRAGGLWDQTLQIYATMAQSHPYASVRVREIMNWGKGQQYRTLKDVVEAEASGKRCPSCGKAVRAEWTYCKYCGAKL